MRRYIPFIIVAVVALVTIGSGAMLYRAKRTASAESAGKVVAPGKTGEGTHIRGERDAAVTLEEFGDFQCPPCAMISQHLDELERDYHGRLRLVFRNFPLVANHAHAAEAAYAAEAAGRQDRFWQMHDLLYKEQANWSIAADVPALFNSYAQMLGLDVDRFKADMQSPAVRETVEADRRDGAARGVKSTPTIFINNVVLAPASFSKMGMHAAVDAAIKGPSSPQPK
jgi:protein-disulfide isomerase